MTAGVAWHPDPFGEASWRLWDGTAWSDRTAPARDAPELAPLSVALGRSAMLHQERGGTDVLKCDDTPVGLLHTPFAGDPTAETVSAAWHFDRRGVVTGRAHVIVQPASSEIAQFAWDFGSGTDGTLHFPDGRWFRLARATQLAQEGVASPADYDPNHSIWVWYSPLREPVLSVRLAARIQTKKVFGREIAYTSSSTGKTGSDVWTDFHPAAVDVRELPLLTMLGTALIWWTTLQRESIRRDRF